MKTVFKTAFYAMIIMVVSSCSKFKPEVYTAKISQSGSNSPVVELIGKQSKKINIEWERRGVGVYQGTITGMDYKNTIQFIDPSSNVDHSIRIHVNNEHVQIFTEEWNHDLGYYEFSDDVLNNTSLEIRFYK